MSHKDRSNLPHFFNKKEKDFCQPELLPRACVRVDYSAASARAVLPTSARAEPKQTEPGAVATPLRPRGQPYRFLLPLRSCAATHGSARPRTQIAALRSRIHEQSQQPPQRHPPAPPFPLLSPSCGGKGKSRGG
jgi:hypothetical protein